MSGIKITKDNINWSHIGWDEHSVSKGNYADENTVKKAYWGNKGTTLEAVPVEVEGKEVYRIDEVDKDGNRTGMGFIDQEGMKNQTNTKGYEKSEEAFQKNLNQLKSNGKDILKDIPSTNKNIEKAFADFNKFVEEQNKAKETKNTNMKSNISNNKDTPGNNSQSASKDEIYIVKSGDTLSAIASKYGLDYKELAEYNNISNPSIINVNQEIKIPTKNTKKQSGNNTQGTNINNNTKKSTVKNKSKNNKIIDLTKVKEGTNVFKAINKYSQELKNAEYATVSENLFTTTTTDYINGEPVKVTHVVINNPNQINGAPANGSYGSGLEKSSAAANRLNSSILINGSHFNYEDGTEDLKGENHVVIVNGEIKHDGVSGGNELLLDDKGNIFNAYGKSAQQLVNEGVKYCFSCHSTQVIENGDISPSYREGNPYKRNVIGQSAPGEYYIITDTTYNNRLSATAEYLKSKGVTNAYSLDQGGSVSLVRNSDLINNPSDDSGERAVGDFLYFKE